ncbi:MAG: ABC transporter permease [Candidatus Baltobacteraceae bacterium]
MNRLARLGSYAGEALEALWRNRARSFLTMLGMIIGTGSVIAVLGIGDAASAGIAGSLGAFGDPGLYVSVDSKQDDPLAAQIQYRDAATVAAENADVLAHVFPSYQRTYRMRGGGVDYVGTVTSTSEVHPDTLTLREGRRVEAGDVAAAARVCLLSQPLERRFFGDGAYALGRIVRIDGVRFRVIGVYDELRAGIFTNAGASDFIEIPYTAFHELAPGPVEALQVFPRPGVELETVRAAVVASLRRAHGPQAQYSVQDALAFIATFERTIRVVSDGVTAIGAVALLVAGIGIMNIMLVSVSERTREIGIRKAIGGSRADIVLQFLLEAVILALFGGALGMLLGIGGVLLAYGAVSGLLGPAPIPWALIVTLAAGFSTVVGIVFGTYPALRAGRLDPIEALRS